MQDFIQRRRARGRRESTTAADHAASSPSATVDRSRQLRRRSAPQAENTEPQGITAEAGEHYPGHTRNGYSREETEQVEATVDQHECKNR